MIFYRRLPKIKAMTFDLDDTLYDNRPVIEHLETSIREWMIAHHPVTQHQSQTWWQNLKMDLLHQHPAFIHDVTLWRFTLMKTGLQLLGYSSGEAESAASDGMEEVLRLRNLVSVPDETHRVLSELAQRIPLVAITNGNVDPERIGIQHYFQSVLRAGFDGLSKPYPDLFVKAQAYLALPGQEILHVGDHARTDVYGAKLNGFSACWMNPKFLNLRLLPKMALLPDVEIHQLDELLSLTAF